jgi:hypothetical protein
LFNIAIEPAAFSSPGAPQVREESRRNSEEKRGTRTSRKKEKQRKMGKAGARGKKEDRGKRKAPETSSEPAQPRGFFFRCGRRIGFALLLVLALDIAGSFLLRTFVTVHSCTPYAPSGHLAELHDIVSAFSTYSDAQVTFLEENEARAAGGSSQAAVVRSEGAERLWKRARAVGAVFAQLFRSELHLGPPFYDSTAGWFARFVCIVFLGCRC